MNKYVIVFTTEEYDSDGDVVMLSPPPEVSLHTAHILGLVANILWFFKSIV